MKKYFIILPLCFLFLNCSKSSADGLKIQITYTSGERSKDSHSTTEKFIIDGLDALYSIHYSGRRGPKQNDDTINCSFTQEQIDKINSIMTDKNLNIETSDLDENYKNNDYEYYSVITMTITQGGNIIKLQTNGDTKKLEGRPLYDNLLYLMNKIRSFINKCK